MNGINTKTMSNNKQSSVEQLESDLKIWFAFVRISFPTEIQNSINRAKAMHKEEHSKTWDDSIDNYLERGKNVVRHWSDFDEYYNDKYK